MKLRFQSNSIRLRLKRSEVEQFKRTGRVEETIVLGKGAAFHYVLESSRHVTALEGHLTTNGLLVQVPADAATRWTSGDEVGIESSQPVGKQTRLQILIEKDFACLDRSEEENLDTFPHPLSERSVKPR